MSRSSAGVSRSLPAALEAYELTRRAAKIGFDWDDVEGIFEKIEEEKREILSAIGARKDDGRARIEEEAGDLLFAAVNVARFLDVNPEIALKKANRKFKERISWDGRRGAERGQAAGGIAESAYGRIVGRVEESVAWLGASGAKVPFLDGVIRLRKGRPANHASEGIGEERVVDQVCARFHPPIELWLGHPRRLP